MLFAVEPTQGGQLWGFRQRDALLEGSYQGLQPRHRDAVAWHFAGRWVSGADGGPR